MPQSYATLPLSLGAKSLLLHLCSAADENGESYWRYEDIAKILGRSKASVVTYVRELVDIGLVKAIKQTMANGYNYRRRLKLLQWAEYTAYWKELSEGKEASKTNKKRSSRERNCDVRSVTQGTSRTQPTSSEVATSPAAENAVDPSLDLSKTKTECSVQPAECKNPSGSNYIPKTKTHSDSLEPLWSSVDERNWASFRPNDNDPLGTGNGLPSPTLVDRLEAAIAGLKARTGNMEPSDARRSATELLETFRARRKLDRDAKTLKDASEALSALTNRSAQKAAIDQLSALWLPHWKRLPTPHQIARMLSEHPEIDQGHKEDRALLGKLTSRLWHAKMALKKASESGPGKASAKPASELQAVPAPCLSSQPLSAARRALKGSVFTGNTCLRE